MQINMENRLATGIMHPLFDDLDSSTILSPPIPTAAQELNFFFWGGGYFGMLQDEEGEKWVEIFPNTAKV